MGNKVLRTAQNFTSAFSSPPSYNLQVCGQTRWSRIDDICSTYKSSSPGKAWLPSGHARLKWITNWYQYLPYSGYAVTVPISVNQTPHKLLPWLGSWSCVGRGFFIFGFSLCFCSLVSDRLQVAVLSCLEVNHTCAAYHCRQPCSSKLVKMGKPPIQQRRIWKQRLFLFHGTFFFSSPSLLFFFTFFSLLLHLLAEVGSWLWR